MSSAEMDDKDTAPQSVKRPDFLEKSEYYRKILDMQEEYPHLRSLSLYMEMTEKLRIEGKLGSHSSNSILFANILRYDPATCHRIDCYDKERPLNDEDLLADAENWLRNWEPNFSARVMLLEDFSAAAIDALGTYFNLDPHVFYYHLGLDRQTPIASNLATISVGQQPFSISTCMEEHAPDNFISVPVPCDIRPTDKIRATAHATAGYCQIDEYRTMAKYSKECNDDITGSPIRTYHRFSVIRPNHPQTNTVILLTFPTWHESLCSLHKQSNFDVPIKHFGLDFKGWKSSCIPDSGYVLDSPKKRGAWTDAQWERTEPIFRSLICGIDRQSGLQKREDGIHLNARLWMYSMMDKMYNLSLQTELRCWQQIRVAFATHRDFEPLQQHPKRELRERILQTIDLLEASAHWLDSWIPSYMSMKVQLRARIEIVLKSKRALAAEIQRSIDDYQGEAEMKLIRAKLKRIMTPPSSPIAQPDKSKRNDSVLEMLSPEIELPIDMM